MKKFLSIAAMVGFVCFFGVVQSASAANYFNWGVETLKVDYGINGPGIYNVDFFGSSSRDCTVAHSGSCSMKLPIIGNDSGNQSAGIDTIQWNPNYPWNYVGSPALYYRWWMRIMPGFSWGNGTAKTKTSRTITSSGIGGYTGYLGVNGFWLGEAQQGFPDEDPAAFISYNLNSKADGVWHEYIVMAKPNTTSTSLDGVFQVWIDGVLVGTDTDYRVTQETGWFTDAWGGWMVSPYFQLNGTASDGGTIYVDDFSVDDVFNSIYGGGDTTPPTNVTLTAPSAGATLSGTATVSGTCTDETSIRGVQFKYGSSNIGSEDTSSPYSVSWDTTAVSNDTYSLTAVCTDNGGNSTTSSARSVTVSNALPSNECPSNWKILHPTWIYCDDFETDKSSLWVDNNYYGTRLLRSSGNGLNSSYSLRSTFPAAPSSSSNGGDFTVSFGASPVSPTIDATDTTKYRELYWRVYIRNQTGWQPGTGQKLTRVTSFHNSSWAQSMIAHWWGFGTPENSLSVDPASGVCQGGVYPAGSPACTNDSVITTGWNDFNGLYWLGANAGIAPVLGATKANIWQCLEGYVKLNDSGQTNGVQTLWVDSVQDATKTGLNFVGTYSTYGINIFRLENYMNTGVSQSEYRDWDNLAISTGRVGCTISSGVLYVPLNLRIINN